MLGRYSGFIHALLTVNSWLETSWWDWTKTVKLSIKPKQWAERGFIHCTAGITKHYFSRTVSIYIVVYKTQLSKSVGVWCRSLTSVWLKKTWEHWEAWTEGGRPAYLTSKQTHSHCNNSLYCAAFFTVMIVFLFFRIKSHPYYPFVWGCQETGEKRHQPDQLHSVNLQYCLTNDDGIWRWGQIWRLKKIQI